MPCHLPKKRQLFEMGGRTVGGHSRASSTGPPEKRLKVPGGEVFWQEGSSPSSSSTFSPTESDVRLVLDDDVVRKERLSVASHGDEVWVISKHAKNRKDVEYHKLSPAEKMEFDEAMYNVE